MKSMQTSE